MAFSSGSGTSSGSSGLQNSGSSEEDLQQLMDQRKRKRMISNRESARRSRMRKQKHLDELMVQVTELRKENSQIIATMNVTTQQYLNVEAENSVLKAQVAELSHRLQSLNEIIHFLNANIISGGCLGTEGEPFGFAEFGDHGFLNNSWNNHLYLSHQQQPPLLASANMLRY
ncbi:hypothetical protein ACH5RR_022042 [Cinchona calisaya]|uniref:BZIP domain-containing protein n=1 Tax=Cinchona calisaya TaxID=153742 RepID=A0ABD2Z9Z9_9GENT